VIAITVIVIMGEPPAMQQPLIISLGWFVILSRTSRRADADGKFGNRFNTASGSADLENERESQRRQIDETLRNVPAALCSRA